jgi:hypothetical protein
MLEGANPTVNSGSATSLSVDGDDLQELLLSWDVSASIPVSGVVTAASLSLRVSDKSSDTFNLYAALPTWAESQATWNVSATGSAWQVAGGSGANDRGSVVLGTFTAPATVNVNVTLNAAGIAVVQGWVNNPSTNHGFFVVGPSSTNRLELRASEYSTKSQRPKLNVTWHDVGGVLEEAWQGQNAVATVDGSNVFGANLSGLFYEPASPAVLWAVRNGPETLHRLLWNGSTWANDTASSWSAGKMLRYPGGSGAPDAEDVTKAEYTSSNAYIATERDNSGGNSRLSVLLVDTATAGSTLTATREWNLTANLPAVAANSGLEAITWLPDTQLLASSFYDERLSKTYVPADYPNHGSGLFLVGLEANGTLYAFALDHVGGGYQRVATINSGHSQVMAVSFDREVGYLWAHCDNNCSNQDNILEIDTLAGSPTLGRFVLRAKLDRPSSMGNLNNEGITFAPEATCSGGYKAFFWTDDDASSGHSIRRDSIPCGEFF